jgi:hypothetical protein
MPMDVRLVRLMVVLTLFFASLRLWGTQVADTAAKVARPAEAGEIRLVPHVDERVELLSIVFRLAGNFEYNMSPLTAYTADIDRTFAPYKTHPAVVKATQLAKDRDVGFDAVMAMAVHLSPPPGLTPLVEFSANVPGDRWGKENATAFASLLRDFYRDTNFHAFFDAHRPLYELSESRFSAVLKDLDLGWYERFYGGMPEEHFHVILGINNGGANYGPKVILADGREELFAIIGAGTKADAGRPTFDSGYLGRIIHEFNHSFVNPVVKETAKEMASARRIYEPVAAQMQANAYGSPEIMVN